MSNTALLWSLWDPSYYWELDWLILKHMCECNCPFSSHSPVSQSCKAVFMQHGSLDSNTAGFWHMIWILCEHKSVSCGASEPWEASFMFSNLRWSAGFAMCLFSTVLDCNSISLERPQQKWVMGIQACLLSAATCTAPVVRTDQTWKCRHVNLRVDTHNFDRGLQPFSAKHFPSFIFFSFCSPSSVPSATWSQQRSRRNMFRYVCSVQMCVHLCVAMSRPPLSVSTACPCVCGMTERINVLFSVLSGHNL